MEEPTLSQLRDELITGLGWNNIVNYITVSSTAIAVLDCILTYDLEVTLVWRSEWSLMKCLYFLARYLPFVDCSLALYRQFNSGLPSDSCQRLYVIEVWLFTSGAALVELIFTLRTWAVWGKGKRFTWALFSTYGVMWTIELVLDHFYLKATSYTASPVPQLCPCIMTVAETTKLSVCYVLFMLYDAGLLSLLIIRGVSAYRQGGSTPLMRVVYSDGVIYYIYITALSLFNVLIFTRLPAEVQTLLTLLLRVVHSVLACRVILHIRDQALFQQRGGSSHDSTYDTTSRHTRLSTVYSKQYHESI